MSDCCTDQGKTKMIKIDFGRVSAGKIVRKCVKFLNEGCKKQYYQVHRDPKTNPLDHVFTFEFYNWILLAGGSVQCEIEYHPTVPSHYNVDYFSITDCDRICYKILVQGTCIGPSVVPSVSRLIMVCPKEKQEVKKRLQLTNDSEATAIFMFDIDPTLSPFKLDVTRGTIGPNNHTYVTITFSPLQQGFYTFYLACLIHHQAPIVTELYGYRGPSFSKAKEFTPLIFSEPKPLIRDFEGYMSDGVKIVQSGYPPISVSNNCLDFGKGEFDRKKTSRSCMSQSVCITNHSTTDLIFKWDVDPECIFEIKPRNTTIRGQQSGSFEVHFSPNKPDALFSRELLARAFWKPDGSDPSSGCAPSLPVPIPLVTSIRMIGQSFSTESIGWIPQYEVPRTVVLPPCLPLLPVYTTFLIKLLGHLPMTFRFIPPLTTNFTVKPMVGIIYREYQIVALQMFSKVEANLDYIERWTIQFNGNSKNEIPIEFKAYTEYPKLDFNENDVVEFTSVYPKCEQVTEVSMRNTTRHCISYSFPDLPSAISMEKSYGIIRANEILTYNWIFSPKEIGDYIYTVCCCLQTLEAGCPVGSNVNIPLKVAGRAQHGYLVALPEELNFGTVVYDQTKELSFHAFNFSSVKIHYKLMCKQRGWPVGNITRDVQVLPVIETIDPGCKRRIDFSVTPREPGFYQLVIQYSLRSNSLAEDVLREVEPRDICIVNCICILPGFEVKDLLYFSTTENMSKALLWNFLEIDKFNITTNSLLPGEEKVINLCFPELVLSHEPLLVKLLILNSTPAQSTWSLTRIKKCDCQQVVKTRGLTFKYKEYSCNHRLACTISPKNGTLQPHEQAIVTIKVCYIIPGKTSLQWRLELSNNRNVIINADVVALSDLEICPSLLSNKALCLEKTYIGDMNPMNQMCWMYNSMDHEATYSLDLSPLYRINTENLAEIFSCRNPRGVVPRRSHYPIIFKFQPRKFESYQVTLPLKLGNTLTNLSIKAETDILPRTRFLPAKVPRLDKFSIPELPVCFSVDHIVVSPMPMHSKVNRMIMISNESKNEIIGYQWKSYIMPEILEIKVTPTSGRIQPTKTQSFRVTIGSLSQPCKITGTLCCQFLNLSAQRTYEKSILTYNSLCEELAGQFVITETGMTEPKPCFEPVEKPKPFYKSLSISCYIYSSMDADLKATVEEQLKSSPPAEIRIQKNENHPVPDKTLIDTAAFILEGMIWDILDSKIFMNTLKESLSKVPNVRYGQYVMPLMQRRNLQDRSYNIPPKEFLESIFEPMILGIVHEEFGLCQHHFSSPRDIRQFCYQKIDPRSHQQNKMYETNLQVAHFLKRPPLPLKGPTDRPESEDAIKVELKEFYPESQVKFNIEDDDSSSESNN